MHPGHRTLEGLHIFNLLNKNGSCNQDTWYLIPSSPYIYSANVYIVYNSGPAVNWFTVQDDCGSVQSATSSSLASRDVDSSTTKSSILEQFSPGMVYTVATGHSVRSAV